MGTKGRTRNAGVTGWNKFNIGLVELTNNFMKKNELTSGRNIPIANLPISVHITTPNK